MLAERLEEEGRRQRERGEEERWREKEREREGGVRTSTCLSLRASLIMNEPLHGSRLTLGLLDVNAKQRPALPIQPLWLQPICLRGPKGQKKCRDDATRSIGYSSQSNKSSVRT